MNLLVNQREKENTEAVRKRNDLKDCSFHTSYNEDHKTMDQLSEVWKGKKIVKPKFYSKNML